METVKGNVFNGDYSNPAVGFDDEEKKKRFGMFVASFLYRCTLKLEFCFVLWRSFKSKKAFCNFKDITNASAQNNHLVQKDFSRQTLIYILRLITAVARSKCHYLRLFGFNPQFFKHKSEMQQMDNIHPA